MSVWATINRSLSKEETFPHTCWSPVGARGWCTDEILPTKTFAKSTSDEKHQVEAVFECHIFDENGSYVINIVCNI